MDIINIILTILSIIVTFISILISIDQSNSCLSFVLCGIIVIIEFITIVLLIQQRKQYGLIVPKNGGIADFKLYKMFWKREIISKDLPNRQSLERGYLRVFGKDVERYQILLVDFVLKKNAKEVILAVDITTNPKRLLTRKEYHEKNREFIFADNVIKRVLIIDRKNLNDNIFINDLYEVIMLNKRIGVHIGLITTDYLNSDQILDFIIYGNSVVITEGHQASENYETGDSQLWFLSDEIEKFKSLFKVIKEKSDMYEQCEKFLKKCDIKEGKVINFKNEI